METLQVDRKRSDEGGEELRHLDRRNRIIEATKNRPHIMQAGMLAVGWLTVILVFVLTGDEGAHALNPVTLFALIMLPMFYGIAATNKRIDALLRLFEEESSSESEGKGARFGPD